jgi:hypothetical protein
MEAASRRFSWLGVLIGIVAFLALVVLARVLWSRVDASQDGRAEEFGQDVLRLAPDQAIMFADGDAAVLSLWYFQFTLGNCPDLAVVATNLLHFDWYQQGLRTAYPDLVVPGPYSFAETVVIANPNRPVCYVQYVETTEISCFPPRGSGLP